MAKLAVDLRSFAEGLTQAAIGSMAGKIQGQQMAQQQQEQEFNRALNLSQLQQTRQQQEQSNIFHALQYADPAGQAKLLGQAFNQPDAMAGLRGTRYVQQRPDLAALLPQQPSPAGAPGGWMGAATGQQIPQQAPLQPREFRGPGGVVLKTKGVGKGEDVALQRAFEAASKPFTEADLSGDPDAQKSVKEWMAAFPPQIETPEDVQKAREVIAGLKQAGIGLGPRLTALREKQLQSDITGHQKFREGEATLNDEQWFNALPGVIEAEKSIGERLKGRGNSNVYVTGHEQDITNIQGLRDMRDRIAKGQATDADMATGMDLPTLNDSIEVATKALRGRLGAKLSPRDEEAASREIRAQVDKISPLDVTPEKIRALYKNWHGRDLSYLVEGLPDEALKMGDARLYSRRAQLTGQLAGWVNLDPKGQQVLLDELRDINSRLGLEFKIPDKLTPQLTPRQIQDQANWEKDYDLKLAANARAEADQWLRTQKADRDRQEKVGTLTDKQKAALTAVNADLNAAAANLAKVAERERVRPSQITDFNNPADQRQSKYVAAYKDYQSKVQARKMKLRELGINVPAVQPGTTPAFKTPEAPPEPAPKGILDQAKETFETAVQKFLPPGGSAKASSAKQEYKGPELQKKQLRQQLIAGLKARKRTDAQINAVLRAHPELW